MCRCREALLREDALEACFDGLRERCAETTVRLNEPSSVLREPQARSRSGVAVFEESKSGRMVQFAEQPPSVPVRHTHALRGAAQRSEFVNGLEQLCLAIAEQGARAEGQPELRFDAKVARTRAERLIVSF